MKRTCKKISLYFLILWLFLCKNFYANADDIDVAWLAISKELTTWEVEHTNQRINFLWSISGKFWENYHKAHEDLNLWERIFWWILEIDDIINYMVFVIKFLSQLWLLVWAFFIIYAWYKYMTNILLWSKAVPTTTVKNAIIWVIIVIFSYAIMRVLTSFIWLT